MSFNENKREKIQRYMLEKIDMGDKEFTRKTADTFDVSMTTVYRYIKSLEEKHIICKAGNRYILESVVQTAKLRRAKNELRDEDVIYARYIRKQVSDLADNVQRIWYYAFTEMMNNAIDHSEAGTVWIMIKKNYLNTTIMLMDNGVGIFRKITEYYQYDSLDDAVRELFKGKLTTDTENHSGEGIFFTSRALDLFAAVSDGKIFSHNKYSEVFASVKDEALLKPWENRAGTTIYMQLSNFSNRKISEVFDMYADADGGLTKTCVPIKNMFEMDPVSRSQAKRLCNRFEDFCEIELDFNGVQEIGQGFAHEIFVVFQNRHQNVKLIPVNMTKEVEKMIKHVLASNLRR
ncbi:MAG: DUF4325 domain-containing protein [Eubacteriales bacterium]|nr:DUF4325 domain-containing protein [Eubacteriales bacterium]